MSQILDKCNQLVCNIKENGFLQYFLKNCVSIEQNIVPKLNEISKVLWYVNQKNDILVQMNPYLVWNISSNACVQNTHNDNLVLDVIKKHGFWDFFSKHCCKELHFANVNKFIGITKDEYKNAWFIDKNKQIIYFKFRHVYGEGSVKKTYLGWNISQNKPCVVYTINCPLDNIEQKRSINEKRIAEVNKSEYLLTINFSCSNKLLEKVFMIADFYRHNIKQMIADNYPLNINDYKQFSIHVLSGLKILHGMKIIHRDIKPSNIVFDTESRIFKLIDFGVATKFSSSNNLNKFETLNSNHENCLSLIGTPGYISPEMFNCLYSLNKANYDESVDIFSFGITLLEFIVKERAFKLDLLNLPKIIKSELELNDHLFNDLVECDADFLKKLTTRLDDVITDKRLEILKNEILEKIDILKLLKTCDTDEKDFFISELIDKNKTINNYCKKYCKNVDIKHLDENTVYEYEFITRMKSLKFFFQKLPHYYNQDLESLLNDYQIYPVIFMMSSYQYPLILKTIDDSQLLDFIQCCINKNPSKRKSIDELLRHPWIN